MKLNWAKQKIILIFSGEEKLFDIEDFKKLKKLYEKSQ